jgi:phosphotriesterase-related protein
VTQDGFAMTVLGEISGSELGATLMHEHVFVDFSYYASEVDADLPLTLENLGRLRMNPGASSRACQLVDLELAVSEVGEFRRFGGGTIVELSLADIGRDPAALAEVSRRTGVQIVAGCGYYVFPTHPPGLAARSEDDVAEELIDEIRHGIGDTGVRPGIIGEIGTSGPIHPTEEKVLRAASAAQSETGLAISVHLHPPARNGHAVLDVLESAGADLTRVVLGHLDLTLAHVDVGLGEVLDYHRSLADRGAWIEYDTIGNDLFWPDLRGTPMAFPNDRERARALAMLIRAGYERRIVLSHDVAGKLQLQRYGGHGYASVVRDFPAYLRLVGVDEGTLSVLTVDNPRELLTVRGSAR